MVLFASLLLWECCVHASWRGCSVGICCSWRCDISRQAITTFTSYLIGQLKRVVHGLQCICASYKRLNLSRAGAIVASHRRSPEWVGVASQTGTRITVTESRHQRERSARLSDGILASRSEGRSAKVPASETDCSATKDHIPQG